MNIKIEQIILTVINTINRCHKGFCKRIHQYLAIAQCRKAGVIFNPAKIRFDGAPELHFHKGCSVSIGEYFRCISSRFIGMDNMSFSKISVHEGGFLYIGHHTGMTNSTINCHQSIIIGNYVNIGAGCIIVDSNFHSLNWRDRLDGTDISKKKNAPVVIKDLAFIGTHSIILKGVTIGEKSIIGAGSVVTHNIPDGEIWAGNPAKFIKKIK